MLPSRKGHGPLTAILTDNHPLLRTVSDPVDYFGPGVQELVVKMKDALDQRGGRGLSAVQIGHAVRVLLIRERGASDLVMVNPELLRFSTRYTEELEGCLSIPARRIKVWRPAKCDVKWRDIDGLEHISSLSGATARIFQHELDHLNGVLMTDRIGATSGATSRAALGQP